MTAETRGEEGEGRGGRQEVFNGSAKEHGGGRGGGGVLQRKITVILSEEEEGRVWRRVKDTWT